MPLLTYLLPALVMLPSGGATPQPRHHTSTEARRHVSPWPNVAYRLKVDATHLEGFEVEMRITHADDTTRLAMSAHVEYDDRYWRYVRDLHVTGPDGAELAVVREDSTVWRFVQSGGRATVRYRIELPPAESPRASWRPFLSPTGGLVGGPHALMYVTSATRAPSRITLDLPAGWEVATGLSSRAGNDTYEAPDVATLMDSPMLVGRFSGWRFAVNGVPHRIAYWSRPGAPPFDTTIFVRGVEAIARQAHALFRRAPYQSYTFIYQDDSYGGLEHRNSVTLGAQSELMARGDFTSVFANTAHEFTHTWNLMALRPAEYGDVSFRTQGPVPTLWFTEGLTIHYADRFLREAGLRTYDSTALVHLERAIERYLAMPGNSHNSAEAISRAEYNAGPKVLGDYPASSHLVGELLGTMMDLTIRASTSSRRSMDDVMRLMMQRHAGTAGFTASDIERAVNDVCGCDLTPLFESYVRGAGPIDFARYLGQAGLEPLITWVPATASDGSPEMDRRIRGWLNENAAETGGKLKLYITDPGSIWGRAGIHTGDDLVTINGKAAATWPELRAMVTAARAGDTLSFEIARAAGAFSTRVVIAGYLRPSVRLQHRADATPSQRSRCGREASYWLER